MKILYILLFLSGFSSGILTAQVSPQGSSADQNNTQDFKIYNYNLMAYEKPQIPGGYSSFLELSNKYTHYSQSMADTLPGDIRVLARVTLDSTGKIIKREAWSEYKFFENDVLSFLGHFPHFEAPAVIENCYYQIHLTFIYKTHRLVPKCFSQDFKMYDDDTLYREKPQFPGGYKNFTRLLRKHTHYTKAVADSLPKNVNVLARISLDSTGKVTHQYAWSENRLFRNNILDFLKNLPDFEGPSHIMDCDIQLHFLFEKYHTSPLKDPSIIYVLPQASKECEKYVDAIKKLDVRF